MNNKIVIQTELKYQRVLPSGRIVKIEETRLGGPELMETGEESLTKLQRKYGEITNHSFSYHIFDEKLITS